jgi:hypothetical protein
VALIGTRRPAPIRSALIRLNPARTRSCRIRSPPPPTERAPGRGRWSIGNAVLPGSRLFLRATYPSSSP